MQEKPKSILFHYSIFNIGGAEKSTLRLMKKLCDSGWKVTLVLTTGGGALEPQIDSRIETIRLRSRERGITFKRAKGVEKVRYLPDLLAYAVHRAEEICKKRLFRKRYYDAAVVSLHGLNADFVCRYVKAKVKLQWIRNDLSLCDPDKKAYRNIKQHLACINRYVCVSATALESLTSLFPEVSNRAEVIYNILDKEQMLHLAQSMPNPLAGYGEKPKVVTVCRLSDKAKGLLRMVRVHRRLLDEGFDFYWFVVGDGSDRELLEQAIEQAGLSEHMILLGSKENPYPYFSAADICATFSYYEGLCGAVNEAKVLGKPVIATEFSGIYEQIVPGKTGIVVKNSEDAIVEGMQALLSDSTLRERLKKASLPKMLWDDNAKIEKLEAIVFKEFDI